MRYKLIFSGTLSIIVLSAFAQKKITNARHWPRYHASIQTMNDKTINGLLIQMADSSMVLYKGEWKELRKDVVRDSVAIMYSQIRQIKLKKQNGFLNPLAIGMAIGLAPAFFGEGGGYVAVLTIPLGIITGVIVGITSPKKYTIKGNYTAFDKMKKKFK
jgi:hypothetical protein